MIFKNPYLIKKESVFRYSSRYKLIQIGDFLYSETCYSKTVVTSVTSADKGHQIVIINPIYISHNYSNRSYLSVPIKNNATVPGPE